MTLTLTLTMTMLMMMMMMMTMIATSTSTLDPNGRRSTDHQPAKSGSITVAAEKDGNVR